MDAVLEVFDGPFAWGRGDCCTSACDVFARLHGTDPMAPLRGRYASETEARVLIRSWGGWRRMTARLADMAGLRPGTGAPGELGLVRLAGGFALAVGLGDGFWAGRIDGGFQTVETLERCWAWPIS